MNYHYRHNFPIIFPMTKKKKEKCLEWKLISIQSSINFKTKNSKKNFIFTKAQGYCYLSNDILNFWFDLKVDVKTNSTTYHTVVSGISKWTRKNKFQVRKTRSPDREEKTREKRREKKGEPKITHGGTG